jgi:hypothetical protein
VTYWPGGRRQLDADHPQLLFERPDDLDQDVLRGQVELTEAVHPRADALRHVCDALPRAGRCASWTIDSIYSSVLFEAYEAAII